MRISRTVTRISIAVAFGLFLVAGAEVAARCVLRPVLLNSLTFDGSNDAYRLHRWVGGRLGYELIPGVVFGDVRINSLGIRDEEREIEKHRGVERILAIGDSVTIGAGLKLEETYPKVLETLLNRRTVPDSRPDASVRYEVWNCGVIGYNARQEAEWLIEKGMGFRPDLVLVGFCPNDFGAPEIQKLEGGRWRVDYFAPQPVPVALELGQGGSDILLAHSYLARVLFVFVWKASRAAGWGSTVTRWFDPMTRDNEEAYADMARVCGRKGVKIAIAIVPYLDDAGGYRFAAAHERLQTVAARWEIPVIDLTGELRVHGLASLRLREDDSWHPGPLGHRLVAEGIERGLVEKGLAR